MSNDSIKSNYPSNLKTRNPNEQYKVNIVYNLSQLIVRKLNHWVIIYWVPTMCQTVTVFVSEESALNKTCSQPYRSLEPKGKDGHWISNCNQVGCYEEACNTGSSPTSPTTKSLAPILHLKLINIFNQNPTSSKPNSSHPNPPPL